jgi:hypothetical protein
MTSPIEAALRESVEVANRIREAIDGADLNIAMLALADIATEVATAMIEEKFSPPWPTT